MIGLNI